MDNLVPGNLSPTYRETVAGDLIRPKLLELLGIKKLPEAVKFDLLGSKKYEGIKLKKLSYLNSLGETVSGVLCIPDLEGPLPGIVCMPGTGGSAEQLTDRSFCFRQECQVKPHQGLKHKKSDLFGWAYELSRRGFVTLSISLKGCAGRNTTSQEWDFQTKLLAPYGVHMMGILVEEALKAARVLQAQTGVDGSKIGVTGMSLGGNATWYAMSCAPWLAAAVPVCGGLGSIARQVQEGNHERHGNHWYIPNILRYFDHADIVASCVSPRPLMIIAPTGDQDMPQSGVNDLVPLVQAAYDKAKQKENFKVLQPPGRHVFKPEYFEWLADWFHQHFVGNNR